MNNPHSDFDDEASRPNRHLPLWRKAALVIALAVGLLGVFLQGVAYFTNEQTTAGPAPSPGFSTQSLTPQNLTNSRSQDKYQQSVPPSSESPVQVSDWSTLFMKLGFSFVVGFSLAYAISGFLRLALFLAGAVFLLLFGLQYAGLVDVQWENLGSYYEAFIAWLQPHIGGFRDFVASNLPASGMASAGLAAGFKR